MFNRKWKPSKTRAKQFAKQMQEIDIFCRQHNISASRSGDSYYFSLNDTNYRVSNHSIQSSPYHKEKEPDVVHIHASKTRIIDIYNDLAAGYILDGHGRRKTNA